MPNLSRVFRFLIANFGPLFVFYGVHAFYGLRPAVIASIGFSVLEIGVKLARKTPFTGSFRFSVAITVVFGILDLAMPSPVFFRYEAALTNFITGIYFALTVLGTRSFIQEFVEQKSGRPLQDPNAILRCRMLTMVWVAYFFLKSGLYAYIGATRSIEEALLIRSTLGSASFYALLAFSILLGRRTLIFLQDRGLLPKAA